MLTLLSVKQDYINERKALWNKMMETSDPIEYNSLANQYNDICQSYSEFLGENHMSDDN